MTEAAASVADLKFSLGFLLTEWDEIVDAWQLHSWESYRDVTRLGQKDAPARVPAREVMVSA